MLPGQMQIVEFLKTIFLFRGLSDAELAQIASRFTIETLESGQRLFSAGDPPEGFFIILEGSVVGRYEYGGDEGTKAVFVPGDFFGEESLLYNRPYSISITATEPTQLLKLDPVNFYRLLREYPKVRSTFARTAESQIMAHSDRFRWLGKDEVVHQIRRKHEIVLLLSLIGPFVSGLVSLLLVFLVSRTETSELAWTVGVITAAALFVIGLGWGIWSWIDWSNDYYIITDQRVVWVEQVIWLYDSRTEAPLSTVLAVSVTSSWLGRVLGYGDVIVRTFTGQVVFRNVGQPQQMAAMVEEYWHRVQRSARQREREEVERAIQRLLQEKEETEIQKVVPTPPPETVQYREPSVGRKYFGNFFKMRFEEGKVITYRKYWTILLGKVWAPTLAILVTTGAMVVLIGGYLTGQFPSPSPGMVLLLGLAVLLFILLPWWLYHYVDWRNDIYQVTDKSIFDIERKPFGTEIRKSAPLENILSLEHERVGFLGYLLNFGNVIINVGETQLIFIGVFDPASVQQEIFYRMYDVRRQKELAEIARERDRVISMIEAYHRGQETHRRDEDSDRFR